MPLCFQLHTSNFNTCPRRKSFDPVDTLEGAVQHQSLSASSAEAQKKSARDQWSSGGELLSSPEHFIYGLNECFSLGLSYTDYAVGVKNVF